MSQVYKSSSVLPHLAFLLPTSPGAPSMPKKHQQKALLIKPTVAASSSNPNTTSAGASNGNRTVNELLRESRRRNGQGKMPNLDMSSFSSLPPPLRALLNMPDLPPRTPRTQVRGPTRTRRIPGPPPPRSWLQDSDHAPEGSNATYLSLRWRGARVQQQNSDMPGGHFPKLRSLEHYALKAIATRWSWHAEYDGTYLSVLPVGSRCTLISYIAIYNDAHWPNPFTFFFPPNCEQGDLDDVTRLDLSNSIGGWATVKKVEQELVVKASQQSKTRTETIPSTTVDIPESWDDDIHSMSAPSSRLLKNLSTDHLRFSNLRHLSLAVDPTSPNGAASASWSQLITLSAHLAPLTSLSLAHWPAPTYMPNASQGRIKIKNPIPNVPDIAYNASDPYTAYDNDWREAAGILRSFSRNLYCLTWLDLSGCGSWLPALSWTDRTGDTQNADWNGAWRNINRVILSVGWLPGRPSRFDSETASSASRSTGGSSIDSTRAIEQLYGESETIRNSLSELARLRLGPVSAAREGEAAPPVQTWNVEEEREKTYFRRDAERYMSLQNSAKEVARELRAIRKSAGGAWIDFEFGEVLSQEDLNIS